MHKNAFMVIIDPNQEQQPAFERALQSAKMTSRSLHLFACVYFDNRGDIEGNRDDAHKALILAHYQTMLDSLQKRAQGLGVETTFELQWQQNWQQAVVSATKNRHDFMVFKSSQVHKLAERSDTTADWALLRESPCPVLLMHNNSNWANRRVLAAINLATQDEAHQRLNEKVLAMANSFKVEYGADVHFVNSVPKEAAPHHSGTEEDDDLLFYVLPSSFANSETHAPEITESLLLKNCSTDKAHIHIEQGEPVEAILAVAEQLQTDLLIVGTIGRTGIKGRIVGNTAEKLLDAVKCDILTLT
jgi:universal stress protein E